MKKLVLAAVFTLSLATFAVAQETPASIYEKIIKNSFAGNFKTLIIDKELYSTQIPAGMKIESKTFISENKFREETISTDENEKTSSIVTIFTSSDTYISYDSGENFFSLGTSFLENISDNIKDIQPFSGNAKLLEKTENVDGKECYVIEDVSDNINMTFYIEKKTYFIVKTVFVNGQLRITSHMSDYEKVKKYYTPNTTKVIMEQLTGSKLVTESTIKIKSVKFNPKINDSIFEPKNVLPLPEIPGFNIKEMIEDMFK